MMQHIKNTMIVNFRFILLILLLISCKKHENFDNKRTSVPISQIIEVKKDSIKDEQVFNFFAVSDEQLFPVQKSKSSIENLFKNTQVKILNNSLMFRSCAVPIVIKNEKTSNLFNGPKNIEIYNNVLKSYNLVLGKKLNLIEPLYLDTPCELPATSWYQQDDYIFFVYDGYVVLFNIKAKNYSINKQLKKILVCEEAGGDMERGFVTNCEVNTNIKDGYKMFFSESEIDDVKYLLPSLPKADIKITNENVQTEYIVKKNTVKINIIYEGGITSIALTENSKTNTEIQIIRFPD